MKLSVQKNHLQLFYQLRTVGFFNSVWACVHISDCWAIRIISSHIFFWPVYTWVLYECVSIVTYLGLLLIKRLYLSMLLCYFTPLIKVCMRRLSSLLPKKCHLIFQNRFITSKGGKLKRELKTLKQWILTSAIMPQFSKWSFNSHMIVEAYFF